MKKGQNAFEFLMTYGWMVLIVGVLIGGLAALNYLSTGRLIPSNCSFASGFECSDFQVTTGAVIVDLENGFGDDVVIDSITAVRQDGSECTSETDVTLDKGETKQLQIDGCNNGNVDGQFNGNIKIKYTIAGSSFTQLGELTSRVEPSSTISTTSTSTSSTSTSTTSTSTTSTSTSTSTTSTIGTGFIRYLGPTVAIDNYYIEQISPDAGPNDGTVDLSNNDARWLSADLDNINVTAWNQTIPIGATINNVTARCEIDFANTDGGELQFSYNTGSGWTWLCFQVVATGGNYECNLYANGVDTVAEINNIDLRCRMKDMGGPGAPGFSVDQMRIKVGYIA